jgi:predicted transcriptional regulator
MTKQITISTRVTEETAAKIDRLSEQLGRNRAWVLHEALQVYIAAELEFIDAVQDGLNDLAQGHVVNHDEVVADWSRRRDGLRR